MCLDASAFNMHHPWLINPLVADVPEKHLHACHHFMVAFASQAGAPARCC
jgi:hypothetical protein